MLVLSRRKGERIVIGQDIEVVVSKIEGNRVKIGVIAPNATKIIRAELPPDGGEGGGKE